MALPTLSASVDFVQELDDRPNDDPNMTSQKLKEQFDKAGNTIKTYLNGTLIPAIESQKVGTTDSRLTNSRQCNNSFDTPLTARSNLKIKTGTSLPGTVEEDCLFFLYS